MVEKYIYCTHASLNSHHSFWKKTLLIQRMLSILSNQKEFSNCVRFSLWGCYNWTRCDINNVSFIARWQQNTPVNHMAAVRRRGVSQVAKETRWRCRRDTAATTQCRLAPVCEILITLNNLLIYPLTHTHTIFNWPKNTMADIYAQTGMQQSL